MNILSKAEVQTAHPENNELPDDESYIPFMLHSTVDTTVLSSEWDILTTIRQTIQLLASHGTKVFFEHIKSHQDEHTKYDNLSPDARLNVDADRIATSYQETCYLDRRNVPILPAAQAQLHLHQRDGFPGGTVTHNFKSAIRFADTAPTLRQHIVLRNKWTPEVFDEMVDWEAHSQALSRNQQKRVHLIKLVHDILPTNHITHHYIQGREPNCPSCSCEREDRDHVYQCPHEERASWRRKFLQEIR